eukprot:NODE_55_length_29507_cov_0.809712.p12 type:complete len:312 gc:universal NODE_55_length_29507_cov_0.809712:5223-4288(-)
MGYYYSLLAAITYSGTLVVPLAIFFIFIYHFPYLGIFYISWMVQDKAAFKNGRRLMFFRKLSLWSHFRDYFPCQLVFDDYSSLKNHKQLLLGSSPHGIIATSTHINFGTESNQISRYIKNIVPVTLNFNFYVPFVRDLFMACGYQSCAKKSCENVLKQGKSLLIVIGGAQEVYYVDPEHYRIIVKKRKGFFKLAFKYGVPVVPVFSFGENSIYTYIQSPSLEKFQSIIKNAFGFVIPIFHGLRFKKYVWSIIPHREPLITIVGKAIPVAQNQNPTEEDIQNIQNLYSAEIERIFLKYRNIYGPKVKKLTVE